MHSTLGNTRLRRVVSVAAILLAAGGGSATLDAGPQAVTTRAVEATPDSIPLGPPVPIPIILSSPVVAQTDDYLIGPRDRLAIDVWNADGLEGIYTVEADGTFTFPLVGRVEAAGLTIREFESNLIKLLADGFFRRPQVTVAIEEYRSQRIFVVGEVREPGTYPLTGGMTLIEAIASAGSTTDAASNEALIVQAGAGGPVLPEDREDASAITVDLEALQSGQMSQNISLHDGDTVFVPRAQTLYVSGEVNSPGQYPIRRGTTVLQALALAGGVTDFGAANRIKIIRVIDGQQVEIEAKVNDPVQADDTIVVPERFF